MTKTFDCGNQIDERDTLRKEYSVVFFTPLSGDEEIYVDRHLDTVCVYMPALLRNECAFCDEPLDEKGYCENCDTQFENIPLTDK